MTRGAAVAGGHEVVAGWRAALSRVEQSRWVLLVAIVAATVLGLIGIGDKSVWLDEAFSVAVARLPMPDLLTYLWRSELYASPYYVLLHFWLALGSGEALVRALSVVIGVGAVIATYFVGRRFGVGFRAALVMAVLPTFVQYEQEARTYTLLTAWAAVTTLAYLRYTEKPSWSRGLVYAFCGALMAYVHPVGAMVVVAHAIHAVLTAAPANRRGLLAAFAVIFLAWVPVLRFALLHRDRAFWIPPLTVATVGEQFIALGGGLLVAAALLVLIAIGLRRDLPTLWLAAPIIGILAMSAFVQPLLQARYLICVLPAAAMLAARGGARAIAVLVVLSLVATGSWYVDGRKDDWRSAVAWVSTSALPGDGILFSPAYGRLAFEYYGEAGESIYPNASWQELYLPGYRFPDAPTGIVNERVWLVEIFGTPAPDTVLAVLDGYQPVEERNYGVNGPDITLLARSP